MRRLVLGLAFLLGMSATALAQGCGSSNPNCIMPTAPFGTNTNQGASTAFVQQALAGGTAALIVGTTPITGAPTNGLLYNNAGKLGSFASSNNGVLVTSGSGVPSISSTLPSGITAPNLIVTGSFTATGLVTNADLANSSLTVNGTVCTLGSSCAVAATTINIANDTTTNAMMFPVWVTANSGALPLKVSSTKLNFNPSTGALSLSGSLGLTDGANGTTLVGPGSTIPTLTSTLSQWYASNTSFPFTGTAIGKTLLKTQHAGSHTGTQLFSSAIDTLSLGSGANGPAQGDYSLAIFNKKSGYETAAGISGEVGGLYIAINQSNGDSSAILAEVSTIGTSGQVIAYETYGTFLSAINGSPVLGIHLQSGVVDPSGGQSYGYIAFPYIANGSYGFLSQDSGGLYLAKAFAYKNSTGDRWSVDHLGQMAMYPNDGTSTLFFTILNNGGTFTITNATGATILTSSQVGVIGIPASSTAYLDFSNNTTLKRNNSTGDMEFTAQSTVFKFTGALSISGAITASSINKLTITPPASGATLTIADGKTLTASNTLTFTGTDGSTLNVGAGGTLGTAALQNTGTSGATIPLFNGANTWSGSNVYTAASGVIVRNATQSAIGLQASGAGTSGFVLLRSIASDDANNFAIYDNTNGAVRLTISNGGLTGIGTVAADSLLTVNINTGATTAPDPGTILHLVGADAAATLLTMDNFGSVNRIVGRAAAGTRASPTATGTNVALLNAVGQSYDGTGYFQTANFSLRTAEAQTATAHGSFVVFFTTPLGSTAITEAVRFNPSGGLSIGTATDPGIGSVQINGQAFIPNMASDTATIDSTVCTATTGGKLLKGTGTLGICLGTSSGRYKHDIVPLEDGLAQIISLEPKNFLYNEGYGDSGARLQYGFVAEDVVLILPRLVAVDLKGKPNSVDILGMVPILVASIKELKSDNDNLRLEIDNLKRGSLK